MLRENQDKIKRISENAICNLNPIDRRELSDYVPVQRAVSDKVDIETIILCDDTTGSAAEDFVIYAKPADKFTIVGNNTRGATGSIDFFPLSLSVELGLTTNRTTYGDNLIIRNIGVTPDYEVYQTLDDMLNQKDTLLEFAYRYLSVK